MKTYTCEVCRQQFVDENGLKEKICKECLKEDLKIYPGNELHFLKMDGGIFDL